MHGKFPVCKIWGGKLVNKFVTVVVKSLSTVVLTGGLACVLAGCAGQQSGSDDLLVPETTPSAAQQARAFAAGLRPQAQGLTSWRELAPGIADNLAYVRTKNLDEVAMASGETAVTWGELQASLERLLELLPRLDAEPGLLASEFQWLKLTGNAHFSGYYEAEIRASRTAKPGYAYPLYGTPADLKSVRLSDFNHALTGMRLIYRVDSGGDLVPYYNREDIDTDGALKGRGLELAWLADPLDAFFLQVQGSGRLRYEDGSVEYVLYAMDNGRPYTAIGQVLSGSGLLEPANVSMQSIRAWIEAHPELRSKVLNRNERYIFFRLGDQGIFGSMGKKLIPMVSLAVDRTTFPLGSVVLFSTPFPERVDMGAMRHTGELQGIGLAQDTGEAIKLRRIDIFCGTGEQATETAGHLNARGPAWLLLKK